MQDPGAISSHQHEEIAMTFHSMPSVWAPEAPAKKVPFIVRLFNRIRSELRLRRAIRDVNSLDDRTLIDIGLSPGSVENAVRLGRRPRGQKL
jgi:uncharacterized protein YjiS (DUF1127 family)